jgi:hypothetical protein
VQTALSSEANLEKRVLTRLKDLTRLLEAVCSSLQDRMNLLAYIVAKF